MIGTTLLVAGASAGAWVASRMARREFRRPAPFDRRRRRFDRWRVLGMGCTAFAFGMLMSVVPPVVREMALIGLAPATLPWLALLGSALCASVAWWWFGVEALHQIHALQRGHPQWRTHMS